MSDTPAQQMMSGERDPPGAWRHATVGGKSITFRLPKGVAVDDFDPDDEEAVELVMQQHGEYGDDDREWSLWAVAYSPTRIIQNYRDAGEVIDDGLTQSEVAEAAYSYMDDHARKEAE